MSDIQGQLPGLVLLENGKEYRRFPPIDPDTGKQARVVAYKEKELINYFNLDDRCMATQDIGIVKKKAFTWIN